MTFQSFLNNIYQIILSFFDFLVPIWNVLSNNFTFKILLYITLFFVAIRIFINLYNLIFSKKLVYTSEDFDEEFWEDEEINDDIEEEDIW